VDNQHLAMLRGPCSTHRQTWKLILGPSPATKGLITLVTWVNSHSDQPQFLCDFTQWTYILCCTFVNCFSLPLSGKSYYSLLPTSPAQQTRTVPTLNAAQKLLKTCRQTSPITLKCTWRRTGRYISYLKVLQNGDVTPTSNYFTVFFHCYTVHVVELLNYYTNHCTYIIFIKFTH